MDNNTRDNKGRNSANDDLRRTAMSRQSSNSAYNSGVRRTSSNRTSDFDVSNRSRNERTYDSVNRASSRSGSSNSSRRMSADESRVRLKEARSNIESNESLDVKKSTRKKSKKFSMQKSVRLTLAALAMVTALVVALIPVQSDGVSAYNTMAVGDIPTVSINDIMTSHASTFGGVPDAGTQTYKAYAITDKIPDASSTSGITPKQLLSGISSNGIKYTDNELLRFEIQDPDSDRNTWVSVNSSSTCIGKTFFVICDSKANPVTNASAAIPLYNMEDESTIDKYVGNSSPSFSYDGDLILSNLITSKYDDRQLGVGYTTESSKVSWDNVDSANVTYKYYRLRVLSSPVSGSSSSEIMYYSDNLFNEDAEETVSESGEEISTISVEEIVDNNEESSGLSIMSGAASDFASSISDTGFNEKAVYYLVTKEATPKVIKGQAFYQTSLPSMDMSKSTIETIGDGAFAETSGTNKIVFPSSCTKVGSGAFYKTSATELTISENNQNMTWGCSVFAQSNISYSPDNTRGELTLRKVNTITCSSLSASENHGIFSHAANITKVNLVDYPNKLPKSTFSELSNLAYVAVENNNTTFDNSEFDSTNANFYIWGRFTDSDKVTPNASREYAFTNDIPYRVDDGNQTYEEYIFRRSDGYDYNIRVDKSSGSEYTTITSIKPASNAVSKVSMNIPYTVGGHTINAISDKAAVGKNNAPTTINIPVTLSAIGEDAFRGITSVKEVHFVAIKDSEGTPQNPVPMTVGKYCFFGCQNLEKVSFKTYFDDGMYVNAKFTEIGDFAFYTNAVNGKPELVFEGQIPSAGELYAPYDLIVNTEVKTLESGDKRMACTFSQMDEGIRYVTSAPEYMEIKYDAGQTKVLLENYPTGGTMDNTYHRIKVSGNDLTVMQCLKEVEKQRADKTYEVPDIVKATGEFFEKMTIPHGVTSIFGLSVDHYPLKEDGSRDTGSSVKSQYFRDLDGTKEITIVDLNVLENGTFASIVDSEGNYKPSTLEKVSFNCDVKAINTKPESMDYTPFQNSENVNEVVFSNLENSKEDAQADDKKKDPNPSYYIENGIIYSYGIDSNGSKYKSIVECLPIRAMPDAESPLDSPVINATTDPGILDVTRIDKKAFEECNSIDSLDFSQASSLSTVEASAFSHYKEGDSGLTSIVFPSSVSYADIDAFNHCEKLHVTIPNPFATCAEGAFGQTNIKHKVQVHGVDPSALKTWIDRLENEKGKPCHFSATPTTVNVTFKGKHPVTGDEYDLDSEAAQVAVFHQVVSYNGVADDPKEKLSDAQFKLYIDCYTDIGWEFNGWSRSLIANETTDIIIYPNYKEITPDPPEPEPKTWTVRYVYQDPTSSEDNPPYLDIDFYGLSPQTGIVEGTKTFKIPESNASIKQYFKDLFPKYEFKGWDKDPEEVLKSISVNGITGDITFFANLKKKSSSGGGTNGGNKTIIIPITVPGGDTGGSGDTGSTGGTTGGTGSTGTTNGTTGSSTSNGSSSTSRPVIVSGAPVPYYGDASALTGTVGQVTNTTNPATGNTNVTSDVNGIPNGQMSATVNGSSDNYVIKITETTEADQSALLALSNAYGSLDNIKFVPFDISLYDAQGINKISPVPDGVSVSITMPIPEELTVYGGNAKVASTSNGYLEAIQPRFTVIDGVPCMNYTVTHLSPYVVYVDTANLTAAGIQDATPKTGDGIHPKWFLSIGLAALSIFLFLKRDRESKAAI